MPVINFINNLIYVLIVFVGAIFYTQGMFALTIGNITSLTQYARQFIQPISNLGQLFNTLQQGLAGAERVFSLIDEESEYVFDGDEHTQKFEGHVVFENVDFGYTSETKVLKNISFEAKKGEVIAIVSPTGSGKTKINNLNTKNEEVINASILANAHDFITKLPKGYESEVTEGGTNFSQGERQLISIARTILSNPDILILDEATSNVDTRTEFKIQESMKTLMAGRTSFVIAHRLQTIRNANDILVVKDGEIIEQGDHNTLLSQKGFYHKLYTTQFADI